jgi:hypothetical protein
MAVSQERGGWAKYTRITPTVKTYSPAPVKFPDTLSMAKERVARDFCRILVHKIKKIQKVKFLAMASIQKYRIAAASAPKHCKIS